MIMMKMRLRASALDNAVQLYTAHQVVMLIALSNESLVRAVLHLFPFITCISESVNSYCCEYYAFSHLLGPVMLCTCIIVPLWC